MYKAFKVSSLFLVSILFLSGCSQKSFHEDMMKKTKKELQKKDYDNFKKSYSESLVDEKIQKKKYVSILEDKTLNDILKELEIIDGNFYYLKSSDILVPKSRIKIDSLNALNNYLKAVLDKELFVKKSGGIYLVKLLSVSETKRVSIEKVPFSLKGELTVEELIKLMTSVTGYEVSIGQNIKDTSTFQNSIIAINSENIIDAASSLASAKNVYVDVDYDNETFIIRRYKDVVIELNVPMLNVQSSNQTASSETTGESKVQNSASIILYDELNSMLKNIISDDRLSTYHIDKASGLIYLKSTKNIENAVRTIAKAYEETFSKEAIIEFERIELVLNKGMEYGISGISDTAIGERTNDVIVNGSIQSGGALSFTGVNAFKTLSVDGKIDNQIGRVLNYSKNLMVLKNNIPSVQSISQNTDYIEKIETTTDANTGNVSTDVTVNTIKDGTAITAQAKISRDKIFLNITPNIKKLITLEPQTLSNSTIKLPEYKDQSYNISREVRLGETAIVGSIIVHDDAKEYQGILPVESFAIGGTDSNSYVRREIVYIVTLRSIKGF